MWRKLLCLFLVSYSLSCSALPVFADDDIEIRLALEVELLKLRYQPVVQTAEPPTIAATVTPTEPAIPEIENLPAAPPVFRAVGPNLARALSADERLAVLATAEQASQATVRIPAARLVQDWAAGEMLDVRHGGGSRASGSYGGGRRFSGLFRGRMRGGRGGGG